MAKDRTQRALHTLPARADVASPPPRTRRRGLGVVRRARVAAQPRAVRVADAHVGVRRRFHRRRRARSAALILVGAWLFGAQVFPAAAVISRPEGVAALAAANPGLLVVWCHSLVGLVWLLNWSTLGASLRARRVIDDDGYRKWYLLRPSAAWIALFALDVAAFHPFASVGDYFLTIGGSRF